MAQHCSGLHHQVHYSNNHYYTAHITRHAYSSLGVIVDNMLPRKRYDNFKCNGTEASLSQCPSDGLYPYKCYSGGYAGVVCQNYGIII